MTPNWTKPHAILALVGIFLDTFVYVPFILKWSWNIWVHRETLIIRKRHSRVIITIGIFGCFYYLIQRNLGFLYYSDIISEDLNNQTVQQHLNYINCYIFPIFNYGLFYIVVYRYWLLYFKTKFAEAQTNGEWQMIIDPKQHDENWWIQNKKKYGSGHYLKKYVFLVWIFVVCIEGTLWLLYYMMDDNKTIYISLAVVSDILIVLFPLILTIYIRYHLPSLIDKLLIKQELKLVFLIIFIAFVAITILSTIVVALSSVFDLDEEIGKALYNTVSNISTFGIFVCIGIQTQWVLYKFRDHLGFYSSRQVLQTTLTQQMLLTKKEKSENKDKISISDVLTHGKAFNVFMNHLIQEHSSECLLSLVEMMQYKETILNDVKEVTFSPHTVSTPTATNTVHPHHLPSVSNVSNASNTSNAPKHDSMAITITTATDDKDQDVTVPRQSSHARTSEAQRNIDALQVALNNNSRSFDDSKEHKTTPSTRSRRRSGSLSNNGLIEFPKSVPKSAIVTNKELDFLSDIPGVEISPRKRQGTTVDEEVISTSSLNIRHVTSPSLNQRAIWQHKSVSNLSKKQIHLEERSGSVIELDRMTSESEISRTDRKNSRKSLRRKKEKKSQVIRSESELIEEWKIRGYMLYYKYIAIGSEFEINIDYGTRHRLMVQMHDINVLLKNHEIDMETLSVLFDSSIHQMYQFCKFSMGRFKQSDGFKKLVRCFDIQGHEEEAPVLTGITAI